MQVLGVCVGVSLFISSFFFWVFNIEYIHIRGMHDEVAVVFVVAVFFAFRLSSSAKLDFD